MKKKYKKTCVVSKSIISLHRNTKKELKEAIFFGLKKRWNVTSNITGIETNGEMGERFKPPVC
jgi:hypothetical protein